MKNAYAGNVFCMSEAEIDEVSGDVVADDDGATLCAVAMYATNE